MAERGRKLWASNCSETLVAEGRGEALDAEAEDAEPLMAKPASESPALAEQLMEEVCDRGESRKERGSARSKQQGQSWR